MARGWQTAVWAAVLGCGAEPAPAGDESSSSPASTDQGSTGADATSADADSSSEDTNTLVQCPGGEVSASWDIALPEPPRQTEAGELDVMATCTMDAPAVQTEAEWTLALTCDEVDGELAQPYSIVVESEDSPFATLEAEMPIELHHARWWGFEFGSGLQLSLVQNGSARLVAIAESADIDPGSPSICSEPNDDFRVTANEWLALVDSRVEPAGCDPDSQFRIVRTADGGDTYAYPGAITALGQLQAAVEDASCTMHELGNETWALRFVIWAK